MRKISLGQSGFIFGQPWHDPIDKEVVLRFAKQEGFDGVELHPYFESFTKDSVKSIKEEYDRYGLEIPCILTAYVSGAYSPINPNEGVRKIFVETMKEMMEFAHALGARVATVSAPMFTGDIIPISYAHDEMIRLFIDALIPVVDTAEENDVVLALEPEPQLILNGGFIRKPIEDVLLVLDAIKSKNFEIVYDVTHANTMSGGDPVEFLKALKGRVAWTHIADNDGTFTPYFMTSKHLAFGEGNINIEAVMKTLKETCPQLGWLQVDVWENTTPFETAKKNKSVLESIMKRIKW
nr:sugar phosphate isomerase/epimerase family protein [Candidatus Njordarchaeum guaymaensis]